MQQFHYRYRDGMTSPNTRLTEAREIQCMTQMTFQSERVTGWN